MFSSLFESLLIICFCKVTSVKAAIRVSEWTREKVSGMKWNADGVCVMSGYEELLRDDKCLIITMLFTTDWRNRDVQRRFFLNCLNFYKRWKRSCLSSLLFLPHQDERWLHFPNCVCLAVFITDCNWRFSLPCRSSVFALVCGMIAPERFAHICLAPSQNSNVWRPNFHVWTPFEPIFTLRVHGWIQTTVSQLADVCGCHRKRQLSFL